MQQQSNGNKLSVGFWSRTFSASEKNYFIAEEKGLSMVRSIRTLRPYLYSSTFTSRRSHHAIRWILSLADSSERLARWRFQVAEYDYKADYRARAMQKVADKESRLRRSEEDRTSSMKKPMASSRSVAHAVMKHNSSSLRR